MRTYLLLLPCTVFCATLAAQDGQSEISAGYGLFSTAGAIVRSADTHSTGLSTGMTCGGRVHSGTFHAGYHYYDYTTQHLPMAIGGAFMYEQVQSAAFDGNAEAGRFDDRFYTLVGKMNLIWFSRGRLMLYGTLAAGATCCVRRFTATNGTSDTATAVHLNFQLSPAGIKYGNRTGVFLEAGLGSKGTVCAGMFARF
jgi:hypothetical protein